MQEKRGRGAREAEGHGGMAACIAGRGLAAVRSRGCALARPVFQQTLPYQNFLLDMLLG
jgi:hypothetical protein